LLLSKAQASTFGFTAVSTLAADGEPGWIGLDDAVLGWEVPGELLPGDCVVFEFLHAPIATNKRQKESTGIQRISTLLQKRKLCVWAGEFLHGGMLIASRNGPISRMVYH